MALFKRKNRDNTDEVPAEIQEYYQAERRERTGVAWLLALVTLVVTVLLAAALFFGGRWIYRSVFQNNDERNQATEQQDDGNSGNAPAPDSSPSPSPSPSPAPAPSPDTNNAQPSSPAAPGSPASPASPAPTTPSSPVPSGDSQNRSTASSTPMTGANGEPLPTTGPAENLAIFIATTVIATALHYAVTSAKTRV